MDQLTHARNIQARDPSAQVMQVSHDAVHEPWKADRLRAVFEKIASRIFSDFGEEEHDFRVRKALLEDDEILSFQRAHPRLYYTLTDRSLMKNQRYRSAMTTLLLLREKADAGRLPLGQEGDAMAASAIVASLTASEGGGRSEGTGAE